MLVKFALAFLKVRNPEYESVECSLEHREAFICTHPLRQSRAPLPNSWHCSLRNCALDFTRALSRSLKCWTKLASLIAAYRDGREALRSGSVAISETPNTRQWLRIRGKQDGEKSSCRVILWQCTDRARGKHCGFSFGWHKNAEQGY